jgi:pimeloyl-ACP methyl ester carboxylesterase
MANYVLIPGAGGDAWYWHRLVPELQLRGHDVVAVDLPAGDDSAGLTEYADAVVDSIGARSELILVAQSLAGFTAPFVCDRVPVNLLVLLNPMIPAPGRDRGGLVGQHRAYRGPGGGCVAQGFSERYVRPAS